MTMFLAPYTAIADVDGSPLDAGFLYLGEYGKDPVGFPVEVFWDADFTVPAAQPIRTRNGYPVRNGSPAKVYLKTAQHSIAIKNRKGAFVLVDFYNKGWDASFVVDASGKNQQEINNEWVSVERYGVRFNTTDDQSTNLQRALNSGNNLLFPKSGTIYANNLAQSTSGQILHSFGSVVIQKNANGPIINSSANYPQIHNIKFRGGSSNTPEFTGDNLVFTGVNPKFINCGSMWAAGRALKATGNAVVIRGSQDIWQTSDTTSTGYDIEIGTSGVCTLYHQLDGIYTSQKTGGILLVDTGSHSLKGGQIGKLNIKAGTKPSGVNGGMTMGCRILGDVNIEQSNTGFSNNQFSDITLTFAAGTSFCIVDASNNYSSGFASVNNGNGVNNIVIRSTGTGADGFAYMTYGAGTTTRSLGMNFSDVTRAWKFDGSVILPNNQAFKIADNTGTERIIAMLAANNNLTIGSNIGSYTYFQGENIGLNSSTGTQVRVSDGFIAPISDNSKTCGTAALRWSNIYSNNGTIQTSDARLKQQFRSQTERERDAALEIKSSICLFKFNDAVEFKGSSARWHTGVRAQEVISILSKHNLNWQEYAFICYDVWDGEKAIYDDDGNVIIKEIESGERYSIRYDELTMFILATI